MPKARGAARFVLVPKGPIILFFASVDEATHLQSPRLAQFPREAQLTIGDANLGGPSIGSDARRGLPYRVPRIVAARVADANAICLGARWIHLEEGAAQVIVVRIDHDLQIIRIEACVTPNETRSYA